MKRIENVNHEACGRLALDLLANSMKREQKAVVCRLLMLMLSIIP